MFEFEVWNFDMVDPDILKQELSRLHEMIKAIQTAAPLTADALEKRIEEVDEWKFGRLPKSPYPANFWTFAKR